MCILMWISSLSPALAAFSASRKQLGGDTGVAGKVCGGGKNVTDEKEMNFDLVSQIPEFTLPKGNGKEARISL